jgi:HK97 family phage major capsid protein
MPAATQTLLDDAIVNMAQWIAGEGETAFTQQEGAPFVASDGVNKPKSFSASDTVDNTAWTWGTLGFAGTGLAGRIPRGPRVRLKKLLLPECHLHDEPQDAKHNP